MKIGDVVKIDFGQPINNYTYYKYQDKTATIIGFYDRNDIETNVAPIGAILNIEGITESLHFSYLEVYDPTETDVLHNWLASNI